MHKNLNKNNIHEVSKASNWIKNNLKDTKNDLTLLDIACGSGRHSIYAASKGYKVISLDISKEKILKLHPIN